ncbi:HNH endonuclease [Microbacterium sp. SSM24]|uniref:HNH endonuclease n=1 Tax=Microbacterium sp. SSM24 TaxID=2991714 RepID=UPI002227B011|nr:HNH endonuclease signature motif containing protein [Microbacterium sp. SSM24]MCW3493378.1 HNH endonuclease [Microbacterium sp. SSM24]
MTFLADDPGLLPDDPAPGWAPPVPDDVELVTEVAVMLSVFAAEQLVRIDALRRRALADGGRYGGGAAEIVERSVRLELAAALRITEAAAGILLAQAEAMVSRYPGALASLGRAGMTERHARTLVDLLDAASPEVRGRLSERAVALAEELPVGSFRRQLRRLIEREESASLTERHERELSQRRVVVEPAAEGMAWLHAYLPAVEAHAIHDRVTRMAKTINAVPDETRTLDQTRADVLADLLIDGRTDAHPAEARGIRATVAVTVPVLALLADDDEHRHAQGLAPATVEGIGPIPLDRARELCGGDAGWMRVLTHPETGMVLSVSRTQYRPPPALRKLIRWRADRCMAPGCGIPASRCEIDHNVAWEHGGHTSLDNHAPLCTGHHTVKHHGGWSVEHLPEQAGALLWTSPAGRRYLVKPERPVPVFRPSGPPGASDAPF